MRTLWSAALVLLAACDWYPSWGHGESTDMHVTVAVGETVLVEVTNQADADDRYCDPSGLIESDLVVRNGKRYWSVLGVTPGTTSCRIGSRHRAHLAVELTITRR
jgi:hypothetical protein